MDGASKISTLIKRAKELGMTALALTDHGNMFGSLRFEQQCHKEGIKPLVGCEFYVAGGSRHEHKGTEQGNKYYHLILIAKNVEGYRNLMMLTSRSFTEGMYYKPRIDEELLRQYSGGLICLSACLAGQLPQLLLNGQMQEAEDLVRRYKEIFGQDHYYIELQDHGIREQQEVAPKLIDIARRMDVPMVVTNDIHYSLKEDYIAQDVLLCIGTKKTRDDPKRMRFEGQEFYMKTGEEMAQLFPEYPEMIDNTKRIADMCDLTIPQFSTTELKDCLPVYQIPPEFSSQDEYVRHLVYTGLEKRYPVVTDEIKARAEYELGIIFKMGFSGYFLIVWDFIKYARDHDIMVGPGRGSAAGSLVSYTLGITKLDPIKYDLLFERFLNPERVSMPDIDVDFCFERRQEVIDYVVRKYGKDRVVQIVTFGTMAARGVIRDVGRVMDLPYAQCDAIAKMIPNELNITIDKALTMNPELRNLYESDETVKTLIDMSKRLEGLPRHTSMHAAGVVISQKAVDEYVPLSRASDGSIVTQFTMTTLEELGLLKMDFLGLRTLTVIQNAVKLAERDKGITLDIDHIDYDDKNVYEMLGAGKTDGVFQLESAGMTSFMKELKPQNLEDVIAGISLYRPGPMDFIPQYIKGKNNADSIHYDCPELEPILKPTYGCIVYQEQVMQIVRSLGGYTLGRSDLVRRAMSKKKAAVMEKERQNFVYGNEEEGVPGCINRGISEEVANKIYDEMIDFAKYAFNKSHAAAYAVVSYQTAYLKYYFPVEFMAALMTSVIDNPSKVSEYILSSRKMGISILPPDINKGESQFSVDNGAIRYGLSAIKSIGRPVIKAIVEERKERGEFKNLQDFIERMSGKDVNKKAIENFIKAGAFDSLPGNRRQKMMIYAQILDSVNQEKKNVMAGQMSLFDLVSEEEKAAFEIRMPDVEEYPKEAKLAFEKEVLGVYISGHPLEEYTERWKKNITAVTADFQPDEDTGMPKVRDGVRAVVGGMITAKTIKYTKNNKIMAFLTLEDLVGTVEIVVFPRDYEKNVRFMDVDAKVFIQGRVSAEDDKASKLICENIYPFDMVPRELWLQFETKEAFLEREEEFYEDIKDSDGKDTVVIYIRSPKAVKRLGPSRSVRIDKGLLDNLYEKYGRDNVKVVEKSIENIRKML